MGIKGSYDEELKFDRKVKSIFKNSTKFEESVVFRDFSGRTVFKLEINNALYRDDGKEGNQKITIPDGYDLVGMSATIRDGRYFDPSFLVWPTAQPII